MIKPEAVSRHHVGPIIQMITDGGFRIAGIKMTRLSHDKAEVFYSVHKGKPFFAGLIEYITSGPVVAMALEKDNATEDFRKLIGVTNPEEAAPGTIRKLFGRSLQENAVHGSDSDDNAAFEIALMFDSIEIFV